MEGANSFCGYQAQIPTPYSGLQVFDTTCTDTAENIHAFSKLQGETLKYRNLGNSDLVVSEVGFGVWTVSTRGWGVVEEKYSMTLLNEGLDLGINFFDTADSYGDGYGEEILAKAMSQHRNDFFIGSKFGYDFYSQIDVDTQGQRPQNFSPSFVRYACEQSLRRLKTDHIDLYQLHNPTPEALESDDLFEVLESLVREGKIRYYGLSLMPDIECVEEAELCMRERPIHSLQMTYNILDQDPARRLFSQAEEKNTGLLCRSPHALGILDATYNNYRTPTTSAYTNLQMKSWWETRMKKLECLDFLTIETNATIGQVAIQFALAHKPVASILPNITTRDELIEFALAPETPVMNTQILERIENLYKNNFHTEDTLD